MSRVGKLPIEIPKGVKVNLNNSVVEVEGPKGKLTQEIKGDISLNIEDSQVVVECNSQTKQNRSYHGLYRKLLQNMVTGVSNGFSKTLLINGVGYRAELKGKVLALNLGYSNMIEFMINDDVSVNLEGNNKVIISGIDKQKVGQAAAEIRSLRPPEPYKGKGIVYENENLRRKIGKSGVK
ncbi:50S ribosomal protein L6 [Marispirochaeta aestuarii]|uniref:Large ribosomal subunit protein uL6 n=1 Tax=Marispirochaeta aestuarii TaxID=1963862 RepID=A0A1Y1S2M6_9SPIO|nr:50S ribosomal protein L6 [Marispirochaeta aestuarii]ORC38221.1 50S ribosomal protein L6 [Marispirochaeta aestuarii]